MQYQAVAFDMDGTLLNQDRLILPETIKAINRIRDKGIHVILVTGRHHSVVYPYYHQLQLIEPVVCCNGTYLYDFIKKRSLDAHPMSKEQALVLLKLVEKFGIHTLIYTDDVMMYNVIDDHLTGLFEWIASLPQDLQPQLKHVPCFIDAISQADHIYKFATSSHNIDALKAFSQTVIDQGDFECEWSWSNRADVALKGNSKGKGLANWASRKHIPLQQIVAFGDNYNDLSMLTTVGLGIAMDNAEIGIQDKVDKVIGSHNEPSIAHTLDALFT